jgi:multiple sugar transport system permease protein
VSRNRTPLRRLVGRSAIYATLIAIAASTVIPFVWMFFTSLHDKQAQIPTMRNLFVPDDKTYHFENYAFVLTFPELPVARFALNSVVVTAGVVAFQLTICSLAAYGFARLRFRGRDTLFFLFLFTMTVPAQVLVVPLFNLVENFGWLDTYWGLILPYPYLSTAFATFLLRQFFITVPRSLDDAARLDGCGDLRILWHVILPSSKPVLATVAAFGFIWTWTDFYWPMLATSTTPMRTLEVGLSVFQDAYTDTFWSIRMTAAIIVLVPVLIVFLFLQRFFVRGVVSSGIKG